MLDSLDVATRIVRAAGAIAQGFLPAPRLLAPKANGEPVTEGDRKVDEFVISSLRREFPDHGFDSEERGEENLPATHVWILDPIDGTKYYARNLPLYSISLALQREGRLVLGVVYAPGFDRLYCAHHGRGARCNGRTIKCSGENRLEQASVCLEIPSGDAPDDQLHWAMEKMALLVRKTCRVRILGVGALGLCFCASGGFDAYVNLGSRLKSYDTAAGQVILEEAGGRFLALGERNKVVAGPETLCGQLRELLGL
jgi:myo-inositol-1(or 4)-monophosphatase